MKITCLGVAAWLLMASVTMAQLDESAVKTAVEQLRKSDANSWKQIPWTASLLEARAASQREGRPLLLFSYEGNIETGRC